MKFDKFMGKKKRIFLGGTYNESTWRDDFIKKIDDKKYEYYNPVVPNWTEECYKQELEEREKCDICLYCITSEMTGVYSIFEASDDSNKRPKKTVFCFIPKGFDKGQVKSLGKVAEGIKKNGGRAYTNLDEMIKDLNGV
jgi:hypothetical protein